MRRGIWRDCARKARAGSATPTACRVVPRFASWLRGGGAGFWRGRVLGVGNWHSETEAGSNCEKMALSTLTLEINPSCVRNGNGNSGKNNCYDSKYRCKRSGYSKPSCRYTAVPTTWSLVAAFRTIVVVSDGIITGRYKRSWLFSGIYNGLAPSKSTTSILPQQPYK